MRLRPPIRRRSADRYTVDLSDAERDLLVSLVDQMTDLLQSADPSLHRLFPRPYGDDEERNEGYAALVVPMLTEQRLEALEIVRSTARSTEVSGAELETWMRSINDVRLVLGTVLGITDDGEPALGADDPETAQQLGMFEYLGMLLELIVAALAR